MTAAIANFRIRTTYQPNLLLAIVLPIAVAIIGPTVSPVVAAWLAALAFYAMFKIWTLQDFARSVLISWPMAIAYLFLWPGMDPRAFSIRDERTQKPTLDDWLWASGKTFVGAWLVWMLAGRFVTSHELIAGWIGLVGLGFLLHFGMFHLLALGWRQASVPIEPIMHAPMFANSVSDFWSRRWNLAFRDLAQVFFFRPFVARVGVGGAIMIVFALSGLIHDLVISLPSGGGYGLPSLYFLAQGISVLTEKSKFGRRIGLGRGLTGRIVSWLVVVPGAYWLFHPPFIREVILPTLSALRAF